MPLLKEIPPSQIEYISRLNYLIQIINVQTAYHNTHENLKVLKHMAKVNQDNAKVIKYYVKAALKSCVKLPHIDLRQSYIEFRYVEKVNSDILMKRFNYDKLNHKLIKAKVKNFKNIFYPEVYKAYLDQLMYTSGLLSRRTIDSYMINSRYFLKKNEI